MVGTASPGRSECEESRMGAEVPQGQRPDGPVSDVVSAAPGWGG